MWYLHNQIEGASVCYSQDQIEGATVLFTWLHSGALMCIIYKTK